MAVGDDGTGAVVARGKAASPSPATETEPANSGRAGGAFKAMHRRLALLFGLVGTFLIGVHHKMPSITSSSMGQFTSKATKWMTATSNASHITHVYHLGHRRPREEGLPYGRSNNQIVAVLHAIDVALDAHGDEFPNHRAVVCVDTWAFDVLKDVFYSGRKSRKFAVGLERMRPAMLVYCGRLKALRLGWDAENVTHVPLITERVYHYRHNRTGPSGQHTARQIQERRQSVVGSLLKYFGIRTQNLLLYHRLMEHLRQNQHTYYGDNGTGATTLPYITVHSRWMEGSCPDRLGEFLPHDECWMPPSYIKDIMGGVVDRPVVLIHDGDQHATRTVIPRLREDADIGPMLVVPQELFESRRPRIPQPWSDTMIGVMGDAFVGTRVSSFAAVAGLLRVVRGADPASNFIFTARREDDGGIEVCEECLFLCEANATICGESRILI